MQAADVQAGGSSNMASLGGPSPNNWDSAMTPQYWHSKDLPEMDDDHEEQHSNMSEP
jgi:hypothetical protein